MSLGGKTEFSLFRLPLRVGARSVVSPFQIAIFTEGVQRECLYDNRPFVVQCSIAYKGDAYVQRINQKK